MIQESKTKRYIVYPKSLIDAAFESAYTDGQDGPVINKPDLAVTVTGVFSMLIMTAMYLYTFFEKGKSDKLWLILMAVCAAVTVFIVYKYFKNLKTYKNYNSTDNSKHAKKMEFFALFGDDIPEEIEASAFLKKVTSIATKPVVVQKPTFKGAMFQLVNMLNSKNNPSDLLCKNITVYGSVLTQARHRYYIKRENNTFVFYDQDFMNPAGEIICDEKEVLSYGRFSAYPASINKSGGKVHQDSYVVEIDAGDGEKIYFEINGREAEKIKKTFKGIKEVK
ncbi:MAG: hypothetical protein E7384_06840 [Ruminococcaceae bacterium]|nr:hypothetical protein [Oscillospiraceae bacterium]